MLRRSLLVASSYKITKCSPLHQTCQLRSLACAELFVSYFFTTSMYIPHFRYIMSSQTGCGSDAGRRDAEWLQQFSCQESKGFSPQEMDSGCADRVRMGFAALEAAQLVYNGSCILSRNELSLVGWHLTQMPAWSASSASSICGGLVGGLHSKPEAIQPRSASSLQRAFGLCSPPLDLNELVLWARNAFVTDTRMHHTRKMP